MYVGENRVVITGGIDVQTIKRVDILVFLAIYLLVCIRMIIFRTIIGAFGEIGRRESQHFGSNES